MQVFRAFQVLVLLIFVAFTQAKTSDSSKNATASKTLDPTQVQPEDNTDAIRKKKSATTTLCVEIRPSGPYQRPFQICEPAGAESKPYPAAAPAQGYYPAPAYEEIKPAVTNKPAAAYEAPAKTYSAPAKPTSAPAYGSSKPYAAHSPSSYSSVSYRSEDGMPEMGGEEEEEHSEEVMDHARAALPDYGLPMTYLQPALKHKAKKGHNGLVITCQPSLAGYAATIPSHGPSYGSYGGNSGGYGGYRAAMSRSSYGRYERPSPPRGYGGYAPSPVYKAPPQPYPYKPSYSAPTYSPPPPPAYKPAPIYKPAPSYNPPAPSYSTPSYSAPAPTYNAPAPSYGPPPSYRPAYAPAPAPAPSYMPPPQSYSHPAPQPVYQPAPAPAPVYAPVPKPHSPPPAPVYSPPGTYGPPPKPHYAPPPTYRDAEEPSKTHGAPSQEEKEKHTVETMTQMAEARESMSMEGHEKVKMPNPGWPITEEGDNKSVTAEEMRAAETMGREDVVDENKV